jgi:hypothetical protein
MVSQPTSLRSLALVTCASSTALMKTISVIGLMWLVTIPALGGELAKSLEDATALADAQEQAVATRGYFAQTLLPYYAQKYASVFQSCFATVPQADDGSFSFVAAIGIDGRVIRLYNDHETNIFVCLRETLNKDVFPKPPASPYYLHIDMKFTDKVEPQPSSTEGAPPLIVEPNQYSYTFGVPKDWEFSFEQARERGVRLAFFPKGGSFITSSSVIYISEVDASCAANSVCAVSDAVAKTIREARHDSPSLQVATENPVKTRDGEKALIRILRGAKDPRQGTDAKDNEALGFIAHDEAIILVVLTARDTKTWEQDYRAFQEIVGGHRFFTCNSPNLATPCSR